MIRVVVLVSGGGTNLQAILDEIEAGTLRDIEITGVISSRRKAYALERAAAAGLPRAVLRSRDYASEADFDRALLEQVSAFGADYIVLAGYMSKIGGPLLEAYPDRILNIHPALLPKYGGAGMYGIRPHVAVLEAGEKETGATVHLVNEEYDRGRILLQKKVKVKPGDTPESLQQRVMIQAERQIYPEVLRRLSAVYPRGAEALESETIEADEA